MMKQNCCKRTAHPIIVAHATMSNENAEFNFELICDDFTEVWFSTVEQLLTIEKIETNKKKTIPAKNGPAAIAALF